MRRPRRPREDFPSRRATRSAGRVTFSLVDPSTNSPGWRMSGSVADVDQLGQVLLVLAHVDDPAGVVAEEAEVLVDVEVDRRGLDAALVERVDPDLARVERLADGAVGENHAGQTIVWPPTRGRSSAAEHSFPSLRTRVRFPSPALQRPLSNARTFDNLQVRAGQCEMARLRRGLSADRRADRCADRWVERCVEHSCRGRGRHVG